MTLPNIQTETALAARVIKRFEPPPDITLTEWSNEFRYLSSESSAEPGKYQTSRAPYQEGVMEAITDPLTEEVVMMFASQTGKTEILNNACGYFIHQDPSPMMIVQPSKEMGEAWSKDRLAPMVRDTPALHGLISIDTKRDGKNTLLHKKFPGGHITITGANSPAGLASRPIRILLLDEIDRYPKGVGREGDPVKLAEKRTTTFWNRRIIKSSTPTIKGDSKIEASYQNSDMRKYWVPCPHCDEYQLLEWAQVTWDKENPEDAHYTCKHCGCLIGDGEKLGMLASGEWRAEKPFKGIAGFHLSSLYSPWVTFGQLAVKFVDAKKLPETLKVFVNTELAETWEEDMDGEGIDENSLINRVEDYRGAPKEVCLITAGVDIQDDRIELEIIGWGLDEESWSIDYRVIHGDPGKNEVWQDLDDILETKIKHELGLELPIVCAAIDSGGHHTEEVYLYSKKKQRQGRRIYPVKGSSQAGKPVISKASKNNVHRVKMFPVGSDTAKDSIFSRLKITEEGAGYCHFPAHYDDEYFKQLTAEKVVVRYQKGKTTKQYVKKTQSARNEALDCRVYGFAAYKIVNPDMKKLAMRIKTLSENKNQTPETAKTPDNGSKTTKPQRIARKKKQSRAFLDSWRK